MIARYPGVCRLCRENIQRGDSILWSRSTGAQHAECRNASDDSEAERFDEDEAAGFEPGTLANDRRLAKRGISVTRFSSGEVQVRCGCIDAPCCGCGG